VVVVDFAIVELAPLERLATLANQLGQPQVFVDECIERIAVSGRLSAEDVTDSSGVKVVTAGILNLDMRRDRNQ
jgi:hypothetical protein